MFNRLERLPPHEVSRAFGMVSRKKRWTSPEEADQKKNISVTDAKEVLQIATTRLSQLIGGTLTLMAACTLTLKHGRLVKQQL